ncbi:MAG: Oligopeptide transport ATP-binding protein OppD [Betaproteobacteria bacterium ADurb.Bin341]|nr:MAG: Oligopeptide transport ATP-binding protein OppD [Betaproteobacteria bacterium ADurb.Bin341]HOG01671.1 ABC transporter ATP-binding protein [Clostridia bacterium]HPK17101.1 ABC transporter ATP-binding protein [Clostridia bacterium]
MADNRETILEVKNLSTYFFMDSGVVKAVDGIDFELKKGSTLGIVGESGSGKSVTSLSIMGLLMDTTGRVVGGEILFEGKDLAKLSDKEHRHIKGNEIAMIFQEPMTSLNPVLTIGEQIIEVIMLHQKLAREEAKRKTLEILRETGLPRVESMINEYPFQLSGGQRQRVMIAMALVCNPKILIADEPTTALDVTIQAQILDLMQRLKDKVGTSIIFITHNLGVVAETCDQVVVMYCGRVVETGDVYSIFKHPSHPYTEGLLASIPKLGVHVDELDSIPGNVPNPKYMPDGCKFAPRCGYATDKCSQAEPPLFPLPGGIKSRCWLREREAEVDANG